MGTSPIHAAMRRLTQALAEMQIPFAIAGAMAANAHGHRRTTADIDILIRRDDLLRFKERHDGLGWLDTVAGSKNFRDTIHGVRIDVLVVGDFTGADGIPYLSLNTLLELKLASGMTAAHRPQDLADVIELIRVNRLPLEHADRLNPFVAEKYRELWRAAQVVDDA